VIAIEPTSGHALRRRPPYLGANADPDASLAWIAAGTSRRGITLDVDRPEGRTLLHRLCERADAVIDTSPPGRIEELGLGEAERAARFPRLVVCSVTPFGATGPRAGWRATDLSALAASGNLYSTGDPERAPVRCSLPTSYFHAGLEAVLAVLMALLARRASGRGQRIDISLQEVMLMPNISQSAQFPLTGNRGARAGSGYRAGKTFQPEIWRCADGWVSFALRGGAARVPGLVALVEWMREESKTAPCLERDWKAYNHNLLTQDDVDEMMKAFGAFFASKTIAELYRAAVDRRLMLAPINDPAAILASAQLAARNFFVAIDEPHLGTSICHPGKIARTLPD
ncbi:MAG: CoA transferase, partial [Candidatus Binatia bacterium]